MATTAQPRTLQLPPVAAARRQQQLDAIVLDEFASRSTPPRPGQRCSCLCHGWPRARASLPLPRRTTAVAASLAARCPHARELGFGRHVGPWQAQRPVFAARPAAWRVLGCNSVHPQLGTLLYFISWPGGTLPSADAVNVVCWRDGALICARTRASNAMRPCRNGMPRRMAASAVAGAFRRGARHVHAMLCPPKLATCSTFGRHAAPQPAP